MRIIKIFLILLMVNTVNLLSSGEFGTKILLLYQSKEGQTAKENLASWHLSPILKNLNFDLEFVDISGSKLPDPEKLDDVYAVIGWLSGNARKNPLELVYWYENLFRNNIRLILMGATGCWQDETTKEYLPDNEINRIFAGLGVIYKGLWTNQKNKIDVTSTDKNIYTKGFSITEDIDYFNFKVIDPELKSYLKISRKDMRDSESVVAFSSLRGGYIFTNQYILKNNEFLVDMKRFIGDCLLGTDGEQRILISGNNKRNIEKIKATFDSQKVSSSVIDLSALTKFGAERMAMYGSVILEDVDFSKVNGVFIDILDRYVSDGGGLVVAGGRWTKVVSKLFGIENVSETKVYLSTNIYFKTGIFPESDKMKLTADNKEQFLMTKTSKDSEPVIYGKLKNNMFENVPFVWERKNGKGKIVVWKKDLYPLNDYRTIFSETALSTLNGHVQFFANVAVMFLDDFPIPSYNIVRNIYPIPSKDDLDDTDFYLDYALPDVLNLLKKYKIPLSTYAIFSYDQDITPPFKNGEYFLGKDNAYQKMFRKLDEYGCEIGLHGYNHQSLSLSSEVTLKWKNRQNMEESLKVAKEDFRLMTGVEYMPFSYVAPMNVIDDTGIEALRNVFPTIKVLSTVLSKDESSYETIMDFGFIPGTDIMKIPRTSFGYQFNDIFIYDLNMGLWDYGAWTHFIHLDDSYDTERNKGILWKNLVNEFDSLIQYVRKNHPYLRYYLPRDAYWVLADYERTDFRFYNDKINREMSVKILSNNSRTDKYFLVRIPDNAKFKKIENGILVHAFRDKEFMLIKTQAQFVKISYE